MRLLTALLLFLLLLNSFFYCLYYKIRIWQREAVVKEAIADNIYGGEVTVIKLPTKTITDELLHDDEITYKNKLYDVIKRQVQPDTVWLYAMADGEEQTLVDKISAYIYTTAALSQTVNHGLHAFEQNINFVPLLYILFHDDNSLNVCDTRVKIKVYNINFCICSYPEVPTPPPRVHYTIQPRFLHSKAV